MFINIVLEFFMQFEILIYFMTKQKYVNRLTSRLSLVILETPDHVKNYRPKVLVMTGNPAHRPPLVNFANLITKNTSLLLCGHVLDDPRPVNIDSLKNNVQLWLKDHKVQIIEISLKNNQNKTSDFEMIRQKYFSIFRWEGFTVQYNTTILKLVLKL